MRIQFFLFLFLAVGIPAGCSGEGKPLELKGHVFFVVDVAFSPDGKELVSAGLAELKRWDAATGKELPSLPQKGGGPVAFTTDGKTLAASDRDSAVILWDLVTKKQRKVLPIKLPLRDIAFSPDGRLLATAGEELKLWDVEKGEVQATVKLDKSPECITFSPDGKLLVVGDTSGNIRVLAVANKKEVALLKGHASDVYSVTFSPDGKKLAATSGIWTGRINLWDVESWKEHASRKTGRYRMRSLAYSPNGKWLVIAGVDGTAKILDADTLVEKATLRKHSDILRCIAFSPDGKHLATGGGGLRSQGELVLWDLSNVLGQEDKAESDKFQLEPNQ